MGLYAHICTYIHGLTAIYVPKNEVVCVGERMLPLWSMVLMVLTLVMWLMPKKEVVCVGEVVVVDPVVVGVVDGVSVVVGVGVVDVGNVVVVLGCDTVDVVDLLMLWILFLLMLLMLLTLLMLLMLSSTLLCRCFGVVEVVNVSRCCRC